MKIYALVILLFLFVPLSWGSTGHVLVLQSLPVQPYDDAFRGFRSECAARSTTLYSSDLSEAEVLRRVRMTNPSLIVAIGADALAKVKKLRSVPVVFLMVLDPGPFTRKGDNFRGISMYVDPLKQLLTLQQLLPKAVRVGILYDPEKSAEFVKRAKSAASAAHVRLQAKPVKSSREAVAAIERLKGEIDALWLLPDTTVITPETTDLLLLAALETGIPVFGFSDRYNEKGLLFSLSVDPEAAGREAGEMANRILSGRTPGKAGVTDLPGGILAVNGVVARQFGVPPGRMQPWYADVMGRDVR